MMSQPNTYTWQVLLNTYLIFYSLFDWFFHFEYFRMKILYNSNTTLSDSKIYFDLTIVILFCLLRRLKFHSTIVLSLVW